MSLFKREPNYVVINGRLLGCMFCRNETFIHRQVTMNTSGMEFLDLGWANRSANGLICAACGLVHEFMNDQVLLYDQRPPTQQPA